MTAFYGEVKKGAPEFVWCPSPMNIQVEIHHKDPGQKLGGLFWEKLGNHAKSPIHIAAAKTARENLSRQLWRTISARLEDPLFDAIGAGMVEVIDGQLEHDLEINAPSQKSPGATFLHVVGGPA